MATDLQGFSKRMTLLADRVAKNAPALVRKVALAADQAVVLSTPVDTGRARSNWIAQIGSAPSTVIESYAPGQAGASAQGALDQAAAVISGYTSGQEIHITNNLPYIQRLNDGFSPQAPAGFVEKAVQNAVKTLKAGRLLDG